MLFRFRHIYNFFCHDIYQDSRFIYVRICGKFKGPSVGGWFLTKSLTYQNCCLIYLVGCQPLPVTSPNTIITHIWCRDGWRQAFIRCLIPRQMKMMRKISPWFILVEHLFFDIVWIDSRHGIMKVYILIFIDMRKGYQDFSLQVLDMSMQWQCVVFGFIISFF